jgi:hypothetical protein
MKERRVLALAAVLLVVGALVTVGPAAAKKTAVDFWEVSCEVRPGLSWVTPDGFLHGRGRVSEAVFYVEDPGDGAMVVGSDTVVANADIDLATGDGGVYGVFTQIYMPDPGSASGTYDGKFSGDLNLFTGFFSGRAYAAGTGDLRRQKFRMTIVSEPAPAWLADELAANPPPCGSDANIFHNTGFIYHPASP